MQTYFDATLNSGTLSTHSLERPAASCLRYPSLGPPTFVFTWMLGQLCTTDNDTAREIRFNIMAIKDMIPLELMLKILVEGSAIQDQMLPVTRPSLLYKRLSPPYMCVLDELMIFREETQGIIVLALSANKISVLLATSKVLGSN